jgi:hypothetical protein
MTSFHMWNLVSLQGNSMYQHGKSSAFKATIDFFMCLDLIEFVKI